MTANPQEELFERARKTIRDLREKLSAAEERSRPQPIAVIGMGINFPGCGTDLDKFWRMIAEGLDAVTSVPADRWDGEALYAPEAGAAGKINTRKAAFLEDVRRFDAGFFDITPREAARMDPQQRIFLETAWHALESAGVPEASVAGREVGVFVGVHNHSADYQAMQFEHPGTLDAYSATGTAHDMIGARLAYWLDLRGPAMTVNTACSSSLLAVHLACQSLRAGDCRVALAGGVNLLLTPGSTIAAAQVHLLSNDGRCKSFDARADGMGRGEGCGIVVLKKLQDATRDGDRVLAVIRGSAVNQDGRTNGLTAPSGLAQRRVLLRALENAGVHPSEVGYVEAHGTGTALGDPIEVEALAEVLGGERRTEPCTLGAVKANIGHLEGAAGVAGLIKAVLVLRHRWLPPVANLTEPNPHFAIAGTGLNIPTQGREWETSRPRIAGVSSFGWSGTNVHVILEEPAPADAPEASAEIWPLLVSARTPEALRIVVNGFADRLEKADHAELKNICYTSAVRRTHHACRVAVQGSEPKEIASALRRRIAETAQFAEHPARIEERAAEGAAQGLETTMRAWERGADVEWSFAFPSRGGVVDLPLYPFQGAQHWLDTPLNIAGESAISSAALRATLPVDWFYSTEWREAPLALHPSNFPVRAATWILYGYGAGLGAVLAEAARQLGDRVIEARSTDVVSPEILSQLVAGESAAYALFVVGDESAEKTIAEALATAQSLIRARVPIKLWFVAQSAGCIDRAETGLCSSLAAIRGFSRVLGLEHPDLCGGLIEADNPGSATAMLNQILHPHGEDHILFKQGVRRVARLRRQRLPADIPPFQVSPDRWYLVTGAFGRLGMEITSWLAAAGARRFALVGRRNPSEMGDPALIARLEALERRGVSVIAEACDVADESAVSGLLHRIGEATGDSGNGLAGVMHAAAGVRFGPVVDASRAEVEAVFRAKCEGARVLDRLTRPLDLDFFVLFSSAAATIGMRNGALYAAANSCLDAVALERQALGLPALCVEWGSWEAGRDSIGSELHEQSDLIERSGFPAMAPRRALELLGALIASGQRSALAAEIDWGLLGPALEVRGRQALVSELIPLRDSSSQQDDSQRPQWLEVLRELPSQERGDRLLDFVAAETRTVFGMAPGDPLDENRGLFQLGMDSLMGVRLRRRLELGTGLRLPGTLTFTYPTITAIAAFLEERLSPADVVQPAADARSQLEETVDAAVAGMSEAETNAAIAAELAAIQHKFGVLADG
jgi:acyl transferase domain-containing protein